MTALLPLRDYQTKTIEALHTRWDAGDTRVPAVLATGLGKTVIFAHLIAQFLERNPLKRALVLVHTDELALQAERKMREVAPHLSVGIVKAERNNVAARIIIGSVQTLRNPQRRRQLRRVGLIVVDECFPAGTLIDGKPIESLKPGDLVPSWDEGSGREVLRPVVALMKSTPAAMVRVTLEDGETFACTPNHPIMTEEGWCPAGLLLRGESVLSFTHDANAGDNLHGVRRSGHLDREGQDRLLSKSRPGVLPGSLSGHVGQAGPVGSDGTDQPSARFGAHDRAQPDASAGVTREDAGDSRGDWAQAPIAGRQRQGNSGTAAPARGVSRVADGSHRASEGWGTSVSLQAGHSSSDDEGVRGGGRGVALFDGSPRIRPEAGREARFTRVADVQILEPGSDGTYGGVCPDGAVYNIEVAGTHTYLIGNGTVAHNCHHAVALTYRGILEHFGALESTNRDFVPDSDLRVAGFTATLARGDKAKLSDIWSAPAVTYGISFGIRRGYLLDVRGKSIVIPDMDLKNVRQTGGDYRDGDLAAELDRVLASGKVAEAYAEHAAGRKGIAFWPTVESAEHGASAFEKQGIRSEVIHGKLGREERRAMLRRLSSGETQVVHGVAVLTEGFDDPTISCVVIARPTRSAPLYQQMVGRGLRPNLALPSDARGDCLILDVVGASRSHDLRSLVDLSERRISEEIAMDEELSLIAMEEFQEEIDRSASSWPEEVWNGETEAVDFDPLGRTTPGAWLQTRAGHYFLPVGRDAYVLLAPSEEPNHFDVAWLPKDPRTKFFGNCATHGPLFARDCGCEPHHAGEVGGFTEHRELSLEAATSWAEEVMEELGGSAAGVLGKSKARWRKDPPTGPQKAWASRLGIDTSELTKGEVSDLRNMSEASNRIDPVVGFLLAARE